MASFFGSHVPRAPTTMASYVTEYPRSRAPTSWSGHRRRQRQCFQTRLQHQAKSLTAFPRQRPQDQAACSTQSPASLNCVMPGLVSGGAELPTVLKDVRQGLSVVTAPPTVLVRTHRGSRPARRAGNAKRIAAKLVYLPVVIKREEDRSSTTQLAVLP
ncbi:hypothetical protein Tsp_14561 [Trichinella spiralis]|uniref:hypothetical protein n=1 Tax=Trichinella spiralis TaxID=6334 RepID=UPI0001EFEFCA|nr:hypothetical protein Tsp_14561 [Trichinella spiralis]